jgi:tetratricopeptide (TPR) repeat protein
MTEIPADTKTTARLGRLARRLLPRRRGVRWGLALLLLSTGAWFLREAPRTGWQRFKAHRAETFVDQGYAAWQQGQVDQAELAFASALRLVPDHRRAQHLHGRMLLQQRRLEAGRQIYARLLARQQGLARQQTASLYLDALLGVGWWAEIPFYAATEFPLVPLPERAHWSLLALESTRLARLETAEAGPMLARWQATHPPTAHWLEVQLLLNAGQHDQARALLGQRRPPQVTGPLAYAAAALALELGDAGRAWLILQSDELALPPAELALRELWRRVRQGSITPAETRRLLDQALSAQTSPEAWFHVLGRLFTVPGGALPKAIAHQWGADAAQWPTERLAAAWLHWELGHRDLGPHLNPWAPELTLRLHHLPRPLPAGPLTSAQFLTLISHLPLTRETVVALVAAVEP